MRKTEYSKLLLDPRWQRKRLEILQRDEFCCKQCFDSNSTLHVHHCLYIKGNDPWDYPDKSLVTLCERCHANETAFARTAKRQLVAVLSQHGFLADHFNDLTQGFTNCDLYYPERQAWVLRWALSDPEVMDAIDAMYMAHIRNKINREAQANGTHQNHQA